MEVWIAAAREHHRLALEADGSAASHRQQRDQVIYRLLDDGWSYGQVAHAIRCSKSLVARIAWSRQVAS